MAYRVLMKVLMTVLIASAAALVPKAGAEAQQSGRQKNATRFTFADGRISFLAPAGFTALTAPELAAKYTRAGGPRRAVGNARRTTTIAYDLLDQPARDTDLDAARRQLAASFETLPNLKWVTNELRRVGSRGWAHLEFTVRGADQDIYNIVFVSVYDGRILIFNFNSTVMEFPQVERSLRESMASITTRR